MNIGKGSSKLPHHLRIVILLLRVAIGLNFFYAIAYDKLQTPVEWAFFIIGAFLVVGLLTRLASIVAIALLVWNYLPTINYTVLNVSHFVNDQVILMICLLVLIFSNAGKYIGLDMFIHIRTGKNKE
jgi:uncharacterized membrane protein YphA (DoxX/SURF4 family)